MGSSPISGSGSPQMRMRTGSGARKVTSTALARLEPAIRQRNPMRARSGAGPAAGRAKMCGGERRGAGGARRGICIYRCVCATLLRLDVCDSASRRPKGHTDAWWHRTGFAQAGARVAPSCSLKGICKADSNRRPPAGSPPPLPPPAESEQNPQTNSEHLGFDASRTS